MTTRFKKVIFSPRFFCSIPVAGLISFFLWGIEELSIQLEEPFSVLPLARISGRIGMNAEEHVQWLDELLERKGELE